MTVHLINGPWHGRTLAMPEDWNPYVVLKLPVERAGSYVHSMTEEFLNNDVCTVVLASYEVRDSLLPQFLYYVDRETKVIDLARSSGP